MPSPSSSQARAAAVAKLQQLLTSLQSEGAEAHARAAQKVPELVVFLLSMLDEQNFKILLTTLQILTALLDRFGDVVGAWPDAAAVAVPPLMEKFADNKIVIRQANLTVLYVYVNIYVCIYTYICMYIYMYKYGRRCATANGEVRRQQGRDSPANRTVLYIYIYIYMYIYIYVYMYIYDDVCVYIYMPYICMHTHTHIYI